MVPEQRTRIEAEVINGVLCYKVVFKGEEAEYNKLKKRLEGKIGIRAIREEDNEKEKQQEAKKKLNEKPIFNPNLARSEDHDFDYLKKKLDKLKPGKLKDNLNNTIKKLEKISKDKKEDTMARGLRGSTVTANDQAAVDPYDHSEEAEQRLTKNIEKSMCQWSTDGSDQLYWGSGLTQNKITAGLYRADRRQGIGFCLHKQIVSTDKLIELPDSDSEYVISEIENFWKLKAEFEKRGLLHKRGILMSGDPGSGKTSTIQMLIKKLIDADGVAIYPDSEPRVTAAALQLVRRIEPNRPIVLIMEDFETMVAHPEYENEWLSILDGESQVDNIVFLATTNYIEKLDKRFTDRPSRFDLIKKVGMPTREARKLYLEHKEPSLQGPELTQWLDETDGLSVSHLKEMLISVKVMGHTLEETIKRLRKMRERTFSSEDNLKDTKYGKRKVGFAYGDSDAGEGNDDY